MLNYHDKKEPSVNVFVFISLVLHAILFFTYPQWGQVLYTNAPGFEQGGVFRVVLSESEPAREWSPISDPTSQTTIPQVEQAKPTSNPPITAANAVQVEPDTIDEITPPVKARPEPENLFQPEEEPMATLPEPSSLTNEEPDSQPVTQVNVEPEQISSEIIGSDSGREIYVEPTQQQEEPIETEPLETLSVTADGTLEQEEQEEKGPSGSGEQTMGGHDEGIGSVVESGTGQAEVALKPPQITSGGGLFARPGGLGYPKNAEDDRAEGVVELEVLVDGDGEVLDVIIINPSQDTRLDEYAKLVIKGLGFADDVIDKVKAVGVDIIISMKMHFSIDTGSYVDEEISVRLAED